MLGNTVLIQWLPTRFYGDSFEKMRSVKSCDPIYDYEWLLIYVSGAYAIRIRVLNRNI